MKGEVNAVGGRHKGYGTGALESMTAKAPRGDAKIAQTSRHSSSFGGVAAQNF